MIIILLVIFSKGNWELNAIEIVKFISLKKPLNKFDHTLQPLLRKRRYYQMGHSRCRRRASAAGLRVPVLECGVALRPGFDPVSPNPTSEQYPPCPTGTSLSPNSRFMAAASMQSGCTGLMTLTPISTRSGMSRVIAVAMIKYQKIGRFFPCQIDYPGQTGFEIFAPGIRADHQSIGHGHILIQKQNVHVYLANISAVPIKINVNWSRR